MSEEPVAELQGFGQRGQALAWRFWHGFVDWLTPPKCLVCRTGVTAGATLCLSCWQKLHFIDEPVCDANGTPFEFDQGEGALSAAAIADPPPWDKARAAVAFDDASKVLVHLLKYRDVHEAGIAMGRMMAGAGRKLLAECDLIVPVPLHRMRLWTRRFNQAGILAREVAKVSDKPFRHDLLLRGEATRPQVGLTAAERQKNVKRAFVISPEMQAVVDGKTVVLVDDVRTTGATAAACAVALKNAGAARVHVLSFALVLNPTQLHIDG